MIKGDKRIALRIIKGAIDLIKVGWTQGRAVNFHYASGEFQYCISGAVDRIEAQLENELKCRGAWDKLNPIRHAAGRVTAELDRLAKRRGYTSRIMFNDSSKTTQAAVVRMMTSAKKNIERGSDARASARSRSK